jgi:DNA-binding LacI/PurR family transcriptional regulator
MQKEALVVRPTLQTVADAVGVSRSTVSNAYSRPDQLSPALREKILETARRLGYAGPDPTARSLRVGSAGAVGVLFTTTLSYAFNDPYAVQFLRGLAEAGERHDTGLLLVPLPLNEPEAATQAVQRAAVDAFCVYCVPEWHASRPAVAARGLPVVSTEVATDADTAAMFVGLDEAGATRAAGEHLVRLGHRRIGVVMDWCVPEPVTVPTPVTVKSLNEVDDYDARERLRGYHEAFAEVGIGLSDLTMVNAVDNSRQSGAAAAAQLLDQAVRPTCVVAFTDLLALGVIDAVVARGLWPGRDVSVVGFDDLPEAEVGGLTTIRQDPLARGRIAGSLLLDPPSDPDACKVVLPTELIVRASTGPAPRGGN